MLSLPLCLVLVASVSYTNSKDIIYPIAPVYCTEANQVARLPVWRLPHDGTVFAMEIYTDEQHIADWYRDHLNVPIWLELEPVQLGYPHGLAWRVHSARHYNTDTGETISYVETRRKIVLDSPCL